MTKTIVSASYFVITETNPCDDNFDQVQLEGRILRMTVEGARQRFDDAGWRTMMIVNGAQLIARSSFGQLFILSGDSNFSLSRIKNFEEGLHLLLSLLDQQSRAVSA